MLRYFFIGLAFLILLVVSMAGFRGHKSTRPPIEIFPDMDHQPKVKAQVSSSFFADGRGARQPVADTVPMGYSMPMHKPVDGSTGSSTSPYKNIQFSVSPDYYNTGKMGDQWGTGIPMEVTPALLDRGQKRFNINCAVCHGATGEGKGIASKYGIVAIANFHDKRLRDMADGEIFNTITHGKNTMMSYGANVQVPDRWAIIAYIRALERSQGATINDVPAEERVKLEAQ
ncbi:MAG: cytochrome c [Chthoniobacterales bacterium]